MSIRREQQDAVDKLILEMLAKGHIHWTDLEKKVLATYVPFATHGRFRGRMKYLLKTGHIVRIERGIYEITEKGMKYMISL